ncbi:MAG TPA: hypothetical protein VFI25_07440 [Planctomycetota bacterium]|jgi:hypothetical protein|nr:hypothetical protein [Planctomycetota bacterium]
MLAPALFGSALAGALLAAGGGKETPIRWSSSWPAALEEAKARNVPVLVIFGKDH